MIVKDKQELRAILRTLYEGRAERDRQSTEICRNILQSEAYRNAKVIGGYMPLAREADITPVLEDALHQGKALVLPQCGEAPHMTLRHVKALTELVPGAYGIREPEEHTPVIPINCVDVLLVPLEGIDESGFRLGKGGGYYDCLLEEADILTIGCALSWQRIKSVPHDVWDIPLSACADQEGLYYFDKGITCRKDFFDESKESEQC